MSKDETVLKSFGSGDIRNIIFKDINGKFAWGTYGDFKVIIMIKSGYINATNLIHQASNRKKFNDWTRTQNAIALTNEISSVTGIPVSGLTKIINGGSIPKITGSYVHPKLIPHIASWASPIFGAKVSEIVNQYFIKIAIEEKDKIIRKKDDKIDRLHDKVDELLDENKKANRRIKRLLTKNDELFDQNEEILGKVETISNDRVVSTGNVMDEHMLIIVKNNDDPEEYDEDDELFDYQVLRVMKKSYKSRIFAHKARHPEMQIVLKLTYSPNSMNLWTRIKGKLGFGRKRKLDISHCKFNLRGKYSEDDLINDVKEIHNERFNSEIDDF